MPIMPDIAKAEAAVVELTNAFRTSSQLQSVASQPALTKAARSYAAFLAAAPIFSHEADGRRPIDRVKAAGYKPCSTAENLAWMLDSRGFETLDLASRLVEGWKASPPHRKSMLTPGATEIGIAIVKARREEKYFSVQLFARPDALRFSLEIENRSKREVAYALAGQTQRIESSTRVRHTLCEADLIEFETKAAGLGAKAVTARFETRDGQVFKLTGDKGGEIRIAVERK